LNEDENVSEERVAAMFFLSGEKSKKTPVATDFKTGKDASTLGWN